MMTTLGKDWITEGLIDFEYKKYLLLAYLQGIDQNFSQQLLYPSLSELVDHYNNIARIKSSKQDLNSQFPRSLNKLSLEESEAFSLVVEDGEEMRCIEEIVEFALPSLKSKINDGKSIYEFVEKSLEFEPVGVLPLYKDEGYIFLFDDVDGDVLIYKYASAFIESSTEKYRSLKTDFVGRERKTLSKSFENIKMNLAKRFSELPNPAAWLVKSNFKFPLIETFLPVTKRVLMQELYRVS